MIWKYLLIAAVLGGIVWKIDDRGFQSGKAYEAKQTDGKIKTAVAAADESCRLSTNALKESCDALADNRTDTDDRYNRLLARYNACEAVPLRISAQRDAGAANVLPLSAGICLSYLREADIQGGRLAEWQKRYRTYCKNNPGACDAEPATQE